MLFDEFNASNKESCGCELSLSLSLSLSLPEGHSQLSPLSRVASSDRFQPLNTLVYERACMRACMHHMYAVVSAKMSSLSILRTRHARRLCACSHALRCISTSRTSACSSIVFSISAYKRALLPEPPRTRLLAASSSTTDKRRWRVVKVNVGKLLNTGSLTLISEFRLMGDDSDFRLRKISLSCRAAGHPSSSSRDDESAIFSPASPCMPVVCRRKPSSDVECSSCHDAGGGQCDTRFCAMSELV